jgi:hypothetical protein
MQQRAKSLGILLHDAPDQHSNERSTSGLVLKRGNHHTKDQYEILALAKERSSRGDSLCGHGLRSLPCAEIPPSILGCGVEPTWRVEMFLEILLCCRHEDGVMESEIDHLQYNDQNKPFIRLKPANTCSREQQVKTSWMVCRTWLRPWRRLVRGLPYHR